MADRTSLGIAIAAQPDDVMAAVADFEHYPDCVVAVIGMCKRKAEKTIINNVLKGLELGRGWKADQSRDGNAS